MLTSLQSVDLLLG